MSPLQRTETPLNDGVMTAQDFAALGFGETAYVKQMVVDGREVYAIHAANGVPMAAVADRELAFIVARQNDLDPVSVQ